MRTICFLFAFGVILIPTFGQDIHWSQPGATLVYQNPAFSGLQHKYGFGIIYRDQWNTIDKNYKTYMASGDYRFGKEERKSWLGLGGMLYNDVSADRSYRVTSGGIALSGIVNTTANSMLSAGLGFNFAQNALIKNNFNWGTQFDGQNFNSAINSGETNTTMSGNFSDLHAGIAYQFHKSETSASTNGEKKLLLGYSVNHLNQPDIGINKNDRLGIKHTFLVTSLNPLAGNKGLKTVLLFYRQNTMMELSGGGLLRFTLGDVSKYTNIKKGRVFSAGLLYRYNDALIPTVEIEIENVFIGLCYDVNVSQLSPASRYRGGFELSLNYRVRNENAVLKPVAPKKKNAATTRSY